MQLDDEPENACGHFHSEPAQPNFFTSMSNAGGEGKTLLTLVLIALCCLQEEDVRVLDADIGNWSIRQQVAKGKVLGWGVQTIKADDIADDAEGAHMVLDLGANALASATEMTAMVPALQSAFAERGYVTIAFIPVSTNKVGAVGAAIKLADNMKGFTKIFVKVNRDGSDAYDAELSKQQSIELGHLPTGFQQYFRGPGGGLVNAILDPPDGFLEASRHLAQWLRKFAAQEQIRAIFPGALRVLEGIPGPTGENRYLVRTLSDATDANLASFCLRSKILTLIDQHGWSSQGLREVADILN